MKVTAGKSRLSDKKPKNVVEKRERSTDGWRVIRTVQTDSPTISQDLLYVFTQNVRTALKKAAKKKPARRAR